jgi:hypothetical protein
MIDDDVLAAMVVMVLLLSALKCALRTSSRSIDRSQRSRHSDNRPFSRGWSSASWFYDRVEKDGSGARFARLLLAPSAG